MGHLYYKILKKKSGKIFSFGGTTSPPLHQLGEIWNGGKFLVSKITVMTESMGRVTD